MGAPSSPRQDVWLMMIQDTWLSNPQGANCRQRGLNLLCSSCWAQGWVTGMRDRVGFGGHWGGRSRHLGQHGQGALRGPPQRAAPPGAPRGYPPRAAQPRVTTGTLTPRGWGVTPWHGDTLQCRAACPKPPLPPAEEQKPAPAIPCPHSAADPARVTRATMGLRAAKATAPAVPQGVQPMGRVTPHLP